MSYTLKLTDGVTSFDFVNSTSYKLLEAGFGSPQPILSQSYDAPPTLHGNDVRQSRYENRMVTLRLRMSAADVSTLRDNIRSLESALTDARDVQIAAYKFKPVNLLRNGRFELGSMLPGTSRWSESGSCSTARITASPTPIEGNYACQVNVTGIGGTPYIQSSNTTSGVSSGAIAARRGKTVTFGSWCYAPSTNTTTSMLRVYDGVALVSGDAFATDGAWHWETVTATLASTASDIACRAYLATAITTNTTNTITIDDAWLVDGSYLPPQGLPVEHRKWHLEVQWGDTETDSSYLEVVSGKLVLPVTTWSSTLTNAKSVIDAQLILECKPFFTERDKALDRADLYNAQSAYTITDNYVVSASTTNYASLYATTWAAMTFTATTSYTLVGAAFSYRIATTGTFTGSTTVAIYSTAAGLPNAQLAANTFDASRIAYYTNSSATVSGPNFLPVWFTSPVAVVSGTVYALVAGYPTGTATTYFRIAHDNGVAGYADGQMCFTSTGGAWVADATKDALFVTFAANTTTNYVDYASTDIDSGVDPGAHLILYPSQVTTTAKKLWIAQRSGLKATDKLWYEGEAQPGYEPSFTQVASGFGVGDALLMTEQGTSYSGGLTAYVRVKPRVGSTWTDEVIGYISYTIASPPRGIFRVLAKCSCTGTTAGDLQVGYGYSYAGVTNTPSYADGDFQAPNSAATLTDLGIICIPPGGKTSERDADAPLYLRFYIYLNGAAVGTGAVYDDILLDYIFLCPIDEGVVALATTTTTDAPVVDTISRFPNVATLDTTTFNAYAISALPDYIGKPFELSRGGARLYVLRDDVIGDYYTLMGKYRPRRLNI